ncbi:MAG: hypothetical protein HYZ34_14145, partial [Ignavibacteriae bacterium]|nr:hypothetical protein [Ignavibacteriota bacterium]
MNKKLQLLLVLCIQLLSANVLFSQLLYHPWKVNARGGGVLQSDGWKLFNAVGQNTVQPLSTTELDLKSGYIPGLQQQAETSNDGYLLLDSSLTISTPTTFDSVRITATGILTVDDSLTVLGDMVVESGGFVTHSGYPTNERNGLQLHVGGTLEVKLGGSINVSGKGLRGGLNGSAYGGIGETYDSLNNVVAGSQGGGPGAGGSYGGLGAIGNNNVQPNGVYGIIEDPQHYGSGGGYSSCGGCNGGGGAGGGRITITATTVIVDGTIAADGVLGYTSLGGPYGGSGSGGAILINTDSVSGSGAIRSVGGNGTNGSACGGGGRIAIYYGTMTFPTSKVYINGGSYNWSAPKNAAAGTIYLKDNTQTYGDLIVSNGDVTSSAYTPLRTALLMLHSASVLNKGSLYLLQNNLISLTVEQPMFIDGSALLRIGAGVTLAVTNSTGFDVHIQSGSSMTLDSGSVLSADRIRISGSSILDANISLNFPNATDLELSGASVFNVLHNTTLSLGEFTTTNIQGGTLYLPIGSRLDVASNSVTVGNGVTLVKDGNFGITDSVNSVTIESGGLLTHSGYPTNERNGLQLHVGGTLEVKLGGSINVSGKGLRGGLN